MAKKDSAQEIGRKGPAQAGAARVLPGPETGPRILFFSGGTALRETSRELVRYTHNSIHIVTPFDSGGSSAALRQAFGMPAVGDVRNRLMALADQGLRGNPEVVALFGHRLPKDLGRAALERRLRRMAEGLDPLVRAIPEPMRKAVRRQLLGFLERMPADFDLKGASIGNLALTAGYLANRRRLGPAIGMFSELIRARGVVRPVMDIDLHLAAELEDGRVVVGQHLLTAKQAPAIDSPVKRLWLARALDDPTPVHAAIPAGVRGLIERADLICYPMGSFYTSLVANLLPSGVGRAVAANPCPKVFVPSAGQDPETLGLDVAGQAEVLVRYLRAEAPDEIRVRDVLNFVLINADPDVYPSRVERSRLSALGFSPLLFRLAASSRDKVLSAPLLVPVLLSLARG